MGGEKAKPGDVLRRKAHRYPYSRAQCRRHGGGWCVHGGDHRVKPERHLSGGEGGKEGAGCFCAGIAPGSYPTSQRNKADKNTSQRSANGPPCFLNSAMPGPFVPGSAQPRLGRDRSQMVSDRPGGGDSRSYRRCANRGVRFREPISKRPSHSGAL